MTTSKVDENINRPTVQGFGDEWSKFDQTILSEDELREIFDQYFRIFPWDRLSKPPEVTSL